MALGAPVVAKIAHLQTLRQQQTTRHGSCATNEKTLYEQKLMRQAGNCVTGDYKL
jgi:hypothetical protein